MKICIMFLLSGLIASAEPDANLNPVWKASLKDVSKFEVEIADKEGVRKKSFQSSSKSGKNLLKYLCDLAAAGPRIPLGEIGETGKERLSIAIDGYDSNDKEVFSALLIRVTNGSVILRVLKCSNDSKELQKVMFIVDQINLNMIVSELTPKIAQ